MKAKNTKQNGGATQETARNPKLLAQEPQLKQEVVGASFSWGGQYQILVVWKGTQILKIATIVGLSANTIHGKPHSVRNTEGLPLWPLRDVSLFWVTLRSIPHPRLNCGELLIFYEPV